MVSPLLLVTVVGAWEFLVRHLDVPAVLVPPPSLVAQSLYRGLTAGVAAKGFLAREAFYLHTLITLMEAIFGFLLGSLLGIVLGAIISQFRFLEDTLYPYILGFQSLPKVAVAPLFVVWFGFGLASKVVIASTVTFFPLLTTTIAGIRSVEADRIELMRVLSATEWQIFWRLKFPSALPYIFAGLDVAILFSLITAIVGEFVGSREGLGVLILQANFNIDLPGMFAVFTILSILGVLFHLAVQALESRVIFWARREERVLGL